MTDNLTVAHSEPPAWATLLITEVRALRVGVDKLADEVDELRQDVRGGGTEPGHAERLRDHDKRITKLEALVKWVAGIATGIATAIGSAWAMIAGGPHK